MGVAVSANGADLIAGEFRHGALLALQRPATLDLVAGVVGVGAKAKVKWIDAAGRIAVVPGDQVPRDATAVV